MILGVPSRPGLRIMVACKPIDFRWPPVRDGAVTLNPMQLRLLFTGMDWTQIGPRTAAMASR